MVLRSNIQKNAQPIFLKEANSAAKQLRSPPAEEVTPINFSDIGVFHQQVLAPTVSAYFIAPKNLFVPFCSSKKEPKKDSPNRCTTRLGVQLCGSVVLL